MRTIILGLTFLFSSTIFATDLQKDGVITVDGCQDSVCHVVVAGYLDSAEKKCNEVRDEFIEQLNNKNKVIIVANECTDITISTSSQKAYTAKIIFIN